MMSTAACTPKELPPGIFNYSETLNPKNSKRYSDSYAPPKTVFKQLTVSHAGRARIVHSYAPKNKPITAILLLLHGSGRTGASLIDSWRTLANKQSVGLLAPDSYAPNVWSFKDDGFEFMQKSVAAFKQARGISDVPVYGFGHSAGAVMMTHLSVRHGGYFRAASVHAGNPTTKDLTSYNKYKKPRAPLIHILGENDHIFKIQSAKASAEILAAQGQNVDLLVIKKHNHWYYDLAPFINQKAWTFMSTQAI